MYGFVFHCPVCIRPCIPPVPSLSIPALSGDAIKDNLLFQEVPMAALELVIDSMASITVPADTDIIKQV
jgi:hypothetical protein